MRHVKEKGGQYQEWDVPVGQDTTAVNVDHLFSTPTCDDSVQSPFALGPMSSQARCHRGRCLNSCKRVRAFILPGRVTDHRFPVCNPPESSVKSKTPKHVAPFIGSLQDRRKGRETLLWPSSCGLAGTLHTLDHI